MHRLLALSLLLVQPSPDILGSQPTPFLIDNNTIPKIVCGKYMGTGVFVGPGLIATAKHVVSTGSCTIDGQTATVVPASMVPGVDFAELSIADKVNDRALIDCGGFHEGESYLATGYALDAPRTVTQMLTGSSSLATDLGFAGESIFRGSITQGQSGGPINRTDNGATVGLITANSGFGITQVLGVSFSQTPLCRKVKATYSTPTRRLLDTVSTSVV